MPEQRFIRPAASMPAMRFWRDGFIWPVLDMLADGKDYISLHTWKRKATAERHAGTARQHVSSWGVVVEERAGNRWGIRIQHCEFPPLTPEQIERLRDEIRRSNPTTG